MTFLLAVFKKPSKNKTYFDQHLYSLFRTVFFFSIPVYKPTQKPLTKLYKLCRAQILKRWLRLTQDYAKF